MYMPERQFESTRLKRIHYVLRQAVPMVNYTHFSPDFSHGSCALRPCLPGRGNLRSLEFKCGGMSQILTKTPAYLYSVLKKKK